MRTPLRITLTTLVTALTITASLPGQAILALTAGAFGSTTLVKDGILNVHLAAAVAPSIGIGASVPAGGAYRLLLQTHVNHGNVNATDDNTAETDVLTALTTVDATLMIEGALRDEIRWQLGAGAIWYIPADKRGIFQSGTTQRWLVAGGLTYHHKLTSTLNLLIAARVDWQEFTTDELTLRGYGKSQSVDRYGLHAGIERRF